MDRIPSDKRTDGRFMSRVKNKSFAPSHHRTSSRESPGRKPLSKNRIYLDVPQSKSVNLPPIPSPRDITEYYDNRPSSYQGSLPDRYINNPSGTRKIVHEKMFSPRNKQTAPRKAMIIGERPPLWDVREYRRPQLPGDLYVDNLQHKPIDWRQYEHVTWNQVLESHQRDVDMYRPRDYAQTLPQKENWLASIDHRVKYSKMNHQRELPSISPRLFNSKVAPRNPRKRRDIYRRTKWGTCTTSSVRVTSRKRSTGTMFSRK